MFFVVSRDFESLPNDVLRKSVVKSFEKLTVNFCVGLLGPQSNLDCTFTAQKNEVFH